MGATMVQRVAHWLCPSELDRSRMLDSSPRIHRARLITTGAVGLALIYFAPEYGWWTLALFAAALANLLTLDRRIAASAMPELHVASSLVVMEAILAAAVALSAARRVQPCPGSSSRPRSRRSAFAGRSCSCSSGWPWG
jgi:hypothetical protein